MPIISSMFPTAKPLPTRHKLVPGFSLPIAFLGACSLTLASAAAPLRGDSAQAAQIAQGVRAQVGALGLKKATVAVSVREADTGKLVYSHHGETPMTPASNMKLLTTGAALLGLPEDFAFTTRMLRDGDKLIIVGDGDPALGDPELLAESSFTDGSGVRHTGMTIENLLNAWVDAVVASGLKRVSEIVVDDRIFAREGAHPSWPKDQLDESYCCAPCGLNFHANTLHVKASPRPGAAPSITSMSPMAPWISITNKATSRTGKGDRNTPWIARQPETGEMTIYGNVKTPMVDPIEVCLTDPALFLGKCMAQRIAARGISVGAARTATAADPAPSGTPVGPALRTPLSTVVTRCNVDSENLYAESLLKRLAAHTYQTAGTWSLGAQAVSATLSAQIGQLAEPFRFSDGSGLSKDNRVSADGMTAWLTRVAGDPAIGSTFVNSLAVGGKSGTVRKRMKDIDPTVATVQCKTGYIDKVSCLSGFVTASDGTRYAFSVLGNNLSEPDSVAKLKKLQERVAKVIADSFERKPRPALGG